MSKMLSTILATTLLSSLTFACAAQDGEETAESLLRSMDDHANGQVTQVELRSSYETFTQEVGTMGEWSAQEEAWVTLMDGLSSRGWSVDELAALPSAEEAILLVNDSIPRGDVLYAVSGECEDKLVEDVEDCDAYYGDHWYTAMGEAACNVAAYTFYAACRGLSVL